MVLGRPVRPRHQYRHGFELDKSSSASLEKNGKNDERMVIQGQKPTCLDRLHHCCSYLAEQSEGYEEPMGDTSSAVMPLEVQTAHAHAVLSQGMAALVALAKKTAAQVRAAMGTGHSEGWRRAVAELA